MIKNIDGLLDKVKSEIRSRADIAVIGLSGGADSTLVCLLCVSALGKDNVYGLHMPYGELDCSKFNANSQRLADHLGIKSFVVSIKSAVDKMKVECSANFDVSVLNQGNMRSRMRMVGLYTTACSISEMPENKGKRVRVVGTGNSSEDNISYQTKYGDSACDFFPIGSLYKSEVYKLLDYFRNRNIINEDMIDRVPSAGLWDGQSDAGEIGYSYDEMEPSLRRILSGKMDKDNDIDIRVYNMYLSGLHKMKPAPVVNLREFCD